MKKRMVNTLLLLLLALLPLSCVRRPLVEAGNTHYVRVYIDENIKNVTHGFYNDVHEQSVSHKQPDVIRLLLADPVTGKTMAERFLRNKGTDAKGTYYDGYIIADYGTYSLQAYNYDTETTIVTNDNDVNESKAYTNEIASHIKQQISSRAHNEDETIAYEPDHLYTIHDDEVVIGLAEGIDTIAPRDGGDLVASSLVKSYYLQVKVKGIQYASSTVGLLTGLSGASWLKDSKMDETLPVTVYFELSPSSTNTAGIMRTGNEDDVVTLFTTFNTFGKIPDLQNKLEITFDFLTTYGKSYSETIDITELFSTPEAINNHWLLIDHIIEIPEPPTQEGGGGFQPVVDDWGEINEDIEI